MQYLNINSLDTLKNTVSPYFDSFWAFFNDYAYLRAAFIATLGYIFAKAAAHYIPRLIKAISRRINFQIGDEIAELSRFPLFSLVFIAGLTFAAFASDVKEPLAGVITAILKSLFILIVAISVYRLIKHLLHRTAESRENLTLIQPQTLPLFTNASMIFIAVAAIHQVFAAWDVDMTALLASAGIAGLAIGMASKDMLSDLISGVLIMSDQPYRVGEVIVLDPVRGKVQHIGLRSTRVLTKDNVEIIIPNSMMGSSRVVNESSSEAEGIRVRMEIQTAYGVDPDKVRNIILGVCRDDPVVMQEANNVVHLIGFTENYTKFLLLFWIEDPYIRGPTLARIREEIYIRFMAEDVQIGLPMTRSVVISDHAMQPQDVLIKEMPESKRTLHIEEMPDIFGNGKPKKISRISRNEAVLVEKE